MSEIDIVSLAKEVHIHYLKGLEKGNVSNTRAGLMIERKMQSVSKENARYMLYAMLTTYVGILPEETLKKIDRLLLSERTQEPIVLKSNNKWNVRVWQGDITTLKISSIVNACNSGMLGCFNVGHKCIDNIIHSKAGPRCREECLSWNVDYEQPGLARLTKGYNLHSDYIVHTVGPIYPHNTRQRNEDLLSSCYKSCLDICMKNNIKTISFCCLSTGEFMYPNEDAAHIALKAVKHWILRNSKRYKFDLIVFNTFKDIDQKIYQKLFPKYFDGCEEEGEVEEGKKENDEDEGEI